jgi:hypothetical protein
MALHDLKNPKEAYLPNGVQIEQNQEKSKQLPI